MSELGLTSYITALIRLFRTQARAGLGRTYEKEKTATGKTELRKGNTSLPPYYNTTKEMDLCTPPSTNEREEPKRKASDSLNQPPIPGQISCHLLI